MRSISLTLGKKVVKWSKLEEKRHNRNSFWFWSAVLPQRPDYKSGEVNYVILPVTYCKPVTPPRATSSSPSANCTLHSFGSILSFPTLEDAMSSIVPDGDKIRDARRQILLLRSVLYEVIKCFRNPLYKCKRMNSVLNLAPSPMQSIPSLLPQEDFLDSKYSPKDVFGEAGPAAPAAEPLQVVLQDRVQPRSWEASDRGGRGRHGMSKI